MLNKPGKKQKEWDKARAKIKLDFIKKGITSCEVCHSTFNLSFAHAVKRRFISKTATVGSAYHLETVALLCHTHHDMYENLPHEAMMNKIMVIIQNR